MQIFALRRLGNATDALCWFLQFQGFRDSGIGSQGIKNSLAMMVKIKSTVLNLPQPSYTMG